MNRISVKLLAALAIFLFVAVAPIVVFATNEDVSIVKVTNSNLQQDYIIYVKGTSNQKFKYAFTTNANPGEMDLSYINSVLDVQENHVAFLDAQTYDELSKENKPIFMWVKDESEELILEKIQLDFSKTLTKDNIENIESLTNKISVKIAEKLEDTVTIKNEVIDGVEHIIKVGYVQILDNETDTYYYELVKLSNTEKYNTLSILVNKIKKEYNELEMYEKLQLVAQCDETLENLQNQANWQQVNEDMKIMQPKSSIEGEEYVLLLKKVDNQGTITTDIQLLTAYDDEAQKTEKEKIVTRETAKLPITYDSIALFIVLGVIIILVIVVLLRINKLNKKDEE